MSKRVLSLVLALVMVLGTVGSVFAESGNAKVDWLVEEGLVVGDAGTGDLRLADPIKRSEVAVMVTKALDLETVANASAAFPSIFKDMSPAHWANGFVNVAAGRGFISGYPNGNFEPDNNVNYAEMASMLVRTIPGAMTAEEQANAVWPTTWLAKAAELGLFDGVTVADFNAAATRENVFNMVYNAVINKQAGNYTIVKAIVLENYRVEKLDKDEVVVEVLRELQRADFAKESRDLKGDQLSLVIPAKVGDVENLLGRVADFTLDKDGNVVAVKVDESYKVEISDFKATKNKFGSYTVELPERYRENDERIFRTYYNNEAFAYEDFYSQDEDNRKEFNVEYAKITVKNGKVLFIDAFNFDDIAPVKEVKKDGAAVVVYNDVREGSTKNISIGSSADVLFVADGNVSVGAREDIEALDVIHEYDGGFIVRKDAAVTGTYEKVTSNRSNEYFVVVDDEEYLIPADSATGKQAVYVYDEDEFYTLSEARRAGATLREFEDKDVTILLDLSDKLQYIGSEIEMGEFVGIVTRVVGRDVRVLKSDDKTYDYTADLDTDVIVDDKTTGHSGLNEIEAGDLVYMAVDGETIEEIQVITKALTPAKPGVVGDITSREIEVDGDNYRILSNTLFFITNGSKSEVITAKQAKDAWDKYNETDEFKAYVIDGEEAVDLFGRRAPVDKDGEAFVVVFTKIKLTSKTKTQIVQFDGWANSRKTEMTVRYADDSTADLKILSGTKYFEKDDTEISNTNLNGRDIIKIVVSDDDNLDISKVTRLIKYNKDDVYEVAKLERDVLTLKDANGDSHEYYTKDAKEFGDSLASADRVKISVDSGKYLDAVLVVSKNWDPTANLDTTPDPTEPVTYIVTDYTPAFGRLTLEDVDTNKSTKTIDSFDAVYFNDVKVSKTVMKAWFADNFDEDAEIVVEITEDNVLVVKETPKTEDIDLGEDTVAVFSQTELTEALNDVDVEVIELYGEFEGFKIDNPVVITGNAVVDGHIDVNSDQVTIEGLTVEYIELVSGVDDIVIKNNLVTGDRFTVGIGIAGGTPGIGKVTIQGNTLENGAIGITPNMTLDNYVITDNTVVTAPSEAIWLWYTAANVASFDQDDAIEFAKELVLNNNLSSEGASLVKIQADGEVTVTEEGVQ